MADSETASRPVLRVVRGAPTAGELAVLTALAARGSGGPAETDTPAPRGRWNDPAWRMTVPTRAGPGAWGSSLR